MTKAYGTSQMPSFVLGGPQDYCQEVKVDVPFGVFNKEHPRLGGLTFSPDLTRRRLSADFHEFSLSR